MLQYTRRNVERRWFECPPDMPEALHQLLIERGIDSPEAAERFLHPDARALIDPFRLSGMAEAVARLRKAMNAGETICVYGDYDVDGVCASAILSQYLLSQGARAEIYLPSRHSEGYGLNEAAVRHIAERADLLVTVDCGVTSVELVALARSLGLDVVVTDHHRPGESLPDCPVVNPLLEDYPFPFLCGAGVAWKLVWALSGEPAPGEDPELPGVPSDWVDVAALATVADVVSLTGENRAIVSLGLERLNRRPRLGLSALIEASGLEGKRVTATTVAFQLAPRLNAGGRLGSAERSLRLVTAVDPGEARALAAELESENTRRKQVELVILREAEDQLHGFDFPAHRALILSGAGWNSGVIGLAASRLVEKYHYPVVLLSEQDGLLTGSCRSIEGVDIHAALSACAEHLIRFGGHRQAAGLTMLPERLDAFRTAMDAWLDANIDPKAYVPVQAYDTELDFDAVNPGFIAALEGLQPTGFGNPAPVFRAQAEVIDDRAVGAEGAHLKLTLAQSGHRLGGIAFREGRRAGSLANRVDVLFVPKLNTFQGRTEPQLEVRALSEAGPAAQIQSKLDGEGELQCNFLTEIFYNREINRYDQGRPTDWDALRAELDRTPQGTLLLCADLACAARLCRRLEGVPLDLSFGAYPEDARCFNAVCAYPPAAPPPAGYRRVVLCGVPEEYPPDAARTLHLEEAPPAWTARMPDLEGMRAVYAALLRLLKRPLYASNLTQLARQAAADCGMEPVAAMAALLAMLDMDLFVYDPDARPAVLRRSAAKKADPGLSRVWRALQRWREAT